MKAKVLGIGLAFGALALANASAAGAADLYVDDSGDDSGANTCASPGAPCQTIGQAVSQPGGDTIHLGGGSYGEAVFLFEGETLTEDSGFSANAAGQAILTAPSGQTAISFSFGSPAATVRNLTVRSDFRAVEIESQGTLTANVFDTPTVPTGGYNADVVVGANGGSPTITGNTFLDSSPEATFPGQVALVLNSPGSPTVSGNTFSGFYESILALSGSVATPQISGNTIAGAHDASGSGSGILTSGAVAPTITGNFIHSPGSGTTTAISVLSTGPATLSRNRTIGHSAGVSIGGGTSATLSSDLMAKATVANLIVSSPTTATNITAADPASLNVVADAANLNLDSSIVSGDPNGVTSVSGGTCSITFSRGPTTSGSPCQTFQTTASPGFANPTANDYHLTAGSPMIDMGNTVGPPPGALDMDGDARSLPGSLGCGAPPPARRDIGADEFVAPIPPCAPTPPVKQCKKGQKLKKGKCVKKKRKRRKRG